MFGCAKVCLIYMPLSPGTVAPSEQAVQRTRMQATE
jgi:hypothetical protein